MGPVEQQIVAVARQHPEYHGILDAGPDALDRDWLPEGGETNPFLHLALHISMLDQVLTDRPPGIRKLYERLIRDCLGDVHEAEHRIMDCLAEEIWHTQRYGEQRDPKHYLKCIKRRGGGSRRRS
jgi:hypothetical protein